MHLFQSNQKSLAMMGIVANQHRFNFKMFESFVMFIIPSISYLIFILRDASELRDYIDTVYLGSSTTMIGLCFLNFVWKMENLFKLIRDIEQIVEFSEYFSNISQKNTILILNELYI